MENFFGYVCKKFVSKYNGKIFKCHIYIYKQIKILLQRASKNLKLAIIFKNYYFFFIKLYSIIKNIFFNLYIIFLLSYKSGIILMY